MTNQPGFGEGCRVEDQEQPAILAADASLIIAWKPHRFHTAPLPASAAPSLADWVFERFPDAGPPHFKDQLPAAHRGKAREDEAGLIHRLDFETSGLVLFARTPEALSFLLAAQEAERIVKTYRLIASPARGDSAVLEGSRPGNSSPLGIDALEWASLLQVPESPPGSLVSALVGSSIECRFRPYGPRGARVACLSPTEPDLRQRRGSPPTLYRSLIVAAKSLDERLDLELRLTRGFRHQIRAQLAWIRLPLEGDALYGGRPDTRLRLLASSLSFPHPATGNLVGLSVDSACLEGRP